MLTSLGFMSLESQLITMIESKCICVCIYGRSFCIFALDITTYDGIRYVHHLSEPCYRGLRPASVLPK